MPSITFGGEEKERVEIQVHQYERAPVGEHYDDNWVHVSVLFSIGAFAGNYKATFLTSDRRFPRGLAGVTSITRRRGVLYYARRPTHFETHRRWSWPHRAEGHRN